MKKYIVFTIYLALISQAFATPSNKKESVIRIDIPNHNEVYHLQDQFHLAIIDAQDRYVDAYATSDLISALKSTGYNVTVLIDNYEKEFEKIPQTYHTYPQVCSIMIALREQYPAISKLETLGFTIQNRAILIMKITDNPLIEEAEPEIRLLGPHHGNEKIATEITLSFLRYLLENYAVNIQVSDLVNNREIWIAPIFNVDGHIGNSRYNNAGVDLNRDYGYMWSGEGNSPGPWSQPETRAVQRHAQINNISLEYEYHSTASYVNYVWDHHPQDPPDSSYISQISQEYADSTYGSNTTRLNQINGYDWYYVRGSAQDALFGIWGGIGTTIETQYPSQQARVDSICLANRRALLAMITRAGWGISGIVRDSITSQPLYAMIQFTDPVRWMVYTDEQVGDFHKMVPTGNYTFKVSANGYQPKSYTVTVPPNGTINVDINLIPDTSNFYYVQKLIWVRRDRPDMAYRTITMDGIGIPDLIYYSLGPGGQIVLEAAPPIRNLSGFDFQVVEGDFTAENYSVSVSNDWRGAWFSCGSGSGSTRFDLAMASMDSARYIKIVDADGGSTSDPYSGFDLDGILYSRQPSSVYEDFSSPQSGIRIFGIGPNPAHTYLKIKYQKSNIKNQILKIYNIEGRIVREFDLNSGSEAIFWNTQDKFGKLVPSGVYFCVIDDSHGIFKQKIVINR